MSAHALRCRSVVDHPRECVGEAACVGKALRAISGKRTREHVVEAARNALLTHLRCHGRRSLKKARVDAGQCVIEERRRSRHRFEDDSGEAEQIRSNVERLTARLLGRHVARRADDGARVREKRSGRFERFHETEVDENGSLGSALRAREDDVARFDVAMDQAVFVRGTQGAAKLECDALGVRPGEGTT